MSDDAPSQRFRLPFLRRDRGPEEEPLHVTTAFESANASGITVVSPALLRFSARADSSPRPLWFYFCIEDSSAAAVRCELRNADQCLGPRLAWKQARPVFSSDGKTWARVARADYVEEAADFGYFAFTVPVVGRKTYVAYCYPYTTADLDAMLQPYSKHRFELCRSSESRPIPYVRLGNHESAQRSVWIIARQHAGETPSSFTVEGAIRTLAAGSNLPSLETTAYHIIPMLDVDGVYHGRYGKDQEPVDFNRDWRDHPVRSELMALLRAIRASRESAPVALAVDLHAPHHGDASCYAFGVPPDPEDPIAVLQGRLLELLAEESPPSVGFGTADVRTDYHPERSAREYLRRSLGIPVVTLEMSYHLAQSGHYLTPAAYRDFGSAVVRAVDRLLVQR
jgi:hypothetical protein